MTDIEDIDDDYELEVLFELRQQEREDAEQRYAEAMEEQERLGKEVEQLQQKHRQMVQEREQSCRQFDEQIEEGGQTLAQVRRFDRYVSELREREEQMLTRIDQARRRRRRARKKMERTHDEMLEAIRQLKAVETHYDDWKQQRDLEQRRKQSARMDEVASRLWRRQHGE